VVENIAVGDDQPECEKNHQHLLQDWAFLEFIEKNYPMVLHLPSEEMEQFYLEGRSRELRFARTLYRDS